MRIVLLEGYLGGSHRAWADGYAAHSAHDVEVSGLPAIHWKWRMQGGHVDLAEALAASVAERGPVDVVLTTTMTSVASLVVHARRVIGGACVVTYVHENQLTFPLPPGEHPDLTYAMTNWTSMLASDLVVFNSQYHHDEWFAAVPAFLARMPDRRHTRWVDVVAGRSVVLPVGVDVAPLASRTARAPRRPPLVLWNQRQEYDKGPDEFAAAIGALLDRGLTFDVAIAGERSELGPDPFDAMRTRLGDRLVHDGFLPLDEYRDLLRNADIVVSTARHEFFGVAVVEAIAAGAFPVLPDRLVYPEHVPASLRSTCLYGDSERLVDRLAWAIEHPVEAAAIADALAPTMARYDWSSVAPRYDAAFTSLR